MTLIFSARRLCSNVSYFKPQIFKYLLVLDFEATCDDGKLIKPFPEIIEMPVVALDTSTWQVKGKFHRYIRPTARPSLTPFCTHLTGIIQDMVDNQPDIHETLSDFHLWLQKEGISDSKFAFVTSGDWDLGIMLPSEASNKNITLEKYFSSWINIKKSHAKHTGNFAKSLRDLLKSHDLRQTGRLHSGIDDVENISAVTKALATKGHVFSINSSLDATPTKKRIFGYKKTRISS